MFKLVVIGRRFKVHELLLNMPYVNDIPRENRYNKLKSSTQYTKYGAEGSEPISDAAEVEERQLFIEDTRPKARRNITHLNGLSIKADATRKYDAHIMFH